MVRIHPLHISNPSRRSTKVVSVSKFSTPPHDWSSFREQSHHTISKLLMFACHKAVRLNFFLVKWSKFHPFCVAFRDPWVQLSVPGLAQRPVVFIELAKALPDIVENPKSHETNMKQPWFIRFIRFIRFIIIFANSFVMVCHFLVIRPDLDILDCSLGHPACLDNPTGVEWCNSCIILFKKSLGVFRAKKWTCQYQTYDVSRSAKDQVVGTAYKLLQHKVEACSPTQFSNDSIMFHGFLRARGSWIWSTATVTRFTCLCWWTLRTSGVGRTSFRVISSTSFTAARQWSFQMGVGQHD